MRSQDFLAAVLPSPGNNYCAVELSSSKKEHKFVRTVDEVYDTAMAFNAKGQDAYFALASFTGNKRLADSAVKVRALFMDIDCNGVKGDKEYASKTEAAAALDTFLASTTLAELGTPWIISSGGGLHVYWPFTEEVSIAEWKPIAENLKRLAKKHDLKIDHSVTADAARILRVPDTFNYKKDKPRLVKIMVEASPESFDFDTVANVLREQMNGHAYEMTAPAPTLSLPGARPKARTDANSVKLMADSIDMFSNIEDASDGKGGCHQLMYFKQHASDDNMEPLWFALISLAKKCEDGYERAKALGEMHPYDLDRLNKKWNTTKGPTPCVKFDSLNPGVCEKCPSFGKITNPLFFSREIRVVSTEQTISLVNDEGIKIDYKKPSPPRGFGYGEDGGIYVDKMVEDENGMKSKKRSPILSYDLYVTDILRVEGEHYVYMTTMRNGARGEITFLQKSIVSKDETLKALASQNVVACYGVGNDKNLYEYVRGAVEYASTNKETVAVPSSYGWQDDGTIVYNSAVYKADGTVTAVPMPGLININHICKPTGSIEEWRRVVNMMIKHKLWNILAMSLVAPASLLMDMTGHAGLVYHMGSSESGTGKSLAQMTAASFFGHPDKYKITHSTSTVASQQRSGMLKNFPIIMDEITSKNRKDFDWIGEYFLDKTQGKGKERMESGANKERLNTTEWSSLDLLSSNSHVLDYLSSRKQSSVAEMLRLLELKLTVVLQLSDEEQSWISNLANNYGIAGEQYIKWLVANRETARKMRADVEAGLKEEFGYSGDERFWFAGNSCIVAAATLLGPDYANIVKVPVKEIIKVLKGMVETGREAVRTSKKSPEDVLNSFTQENYGKLIIVRKLDGKVTASMSGLDLGAIDLSTSRTEVMGRVEHGFSINAVDYFIEKAQLQRQCTAMSFGYDDFVNQLAALPNYKLRYMKKNMMAFTRGPETRMHVLWISRPLDEADVMYDEIKSV